MRPYRTLIVLTVLAGCLIGSTSSECATISWIPGELPPLSWGIDYAPLILNGTISIVGPLDKAYANWGVAMVAAGGAPEISVDEGTNTIELLYDVNGIPNDLPLVIDPVCGLELTVGPLEEGEWRFVCENSISMSDFEFELPPPLFIPEPSIILIILGVLPFTFRHVFSNRNST